MPATSRAPVRCTPPRTASSADRQQAVRGKAASDVAFFSPSNPAALSFVQKVVAATEYSTWNTALLCWTKIAYGAHSLYWLHGSFSAASTYGSIAGTNAESAPFLSRIN